MVLEDVLALLHGVRRHGEYVMARCPAHDDRHASLSVAEGNDGVLLKCHAGCDVEQICDRLRIEVRDLFYEPRDGDLVEASYPYHDRDGNLVYEVVRFDGKRFRQRRPDGLGGWHWNLQGVERVPYRLPELLAGVAQPRRILICEGEKDCDAVYAHGGCATTNPGGAGKWPARFASYLQGAHVWVVADRDDAGRKHAREVTQTLQGKAASLRTVEAKEGKDAFDHLKAGHALDELVPVWEQDGLVALRGDRLRTRSVDWVQGFEHLIPYGAITLLTGMPGAGKTMLTCRVAALVSIYAQVAVVSSEDSPERILGPRLLAADGDLSRVHFLSWQTNGSELPVLFPDHLNALERFIVGQKVRLLVVDPITAHLGPEIEHYSDKSVRSALSPLAMLCDRLALAALVVSHPNKGFSDDPLHRAGGSIGLPGVARSGLWMGDHPEELDPSYRVLAPYKANWAPSMRSRLYRIETTPVRGRSDLVPRLIDMGESYYTARRLLRRPWKEREETEA